MHPPQNNSATFHHLKKYLSPKKILNPKNPELYFTIPRNFQLSKK